jgi:exodeoxyribonuclease VII small subunit
MTAKANAPAPEDAGAITFEQMMGRLQDLVAKLEEGQLSLDESIRSFEEGMALVKKCTEVLDRAEERIQKLTRDSSGRPMTSPLDGDEDEAGTGGDELPF